MAFRSQIAMWKCQGVKCQNCLLWTTRTIRTGSSFSMSICFKCPQLKNNAIFQVSAPGLLTQSASRSRSSTKNRASCSSDTRGSTVIKAKLKFWKPNCRNSKSKLNFFNRRVWRKVEFKFRINPKLVTGPLSFLGRSPLRRTCMKLSNLQDSTSLNNSRSRFALKTWYRDS